MFRPSNGHIQGLQLIHFNGRLEGKIKIQLITEDDPLRAEKYRDDNSIKKGWCALICFYVKFVTFIYSLPYNRSMQGGCYRYHLLTR